MNTNMNIVNTIVNSINIVKDTLKNIIIDVMKDIMKYTMKQAMLMKDDNVTNCVLYIKENILYMIKNVESILISDTFMSIYNRFTLMESLLLLDGVICSICFLKDFIILKLSCNKLSKKAFVLYNEEIVEKYNNIYILSTIDRYIFYICIYIGYNSINYFYIENKYSYMLILLITFPNIQNSILSFHYINKKLMLYNENKTVFVKYNLSKFSIHIIQYLHPQIEKIPNYHIFILYKLLNIKYIIKIIQHCLFICLLTILRSYESTYYYYKGIKMAYYYNVGYLYNVIPLSDAIYTVNIIVREKRWNELCKIEVVNAFFVLFINKYEMFNDLNVSLFVNTQIIAYQIISLYSLISIFKIITIYLSPLWVSILALLIGFYLVKINIKNIITSIIVYFLILFNINDLNITFVIILHKFIYYCIEEIYFFIINIQNVKKVIRMYETPSKQEMISKIKDEYVVL